MTLKNGNLLRRFARFGLFIIGSLILLLLIIRVASLINLFKSADPKPDWLPQWLENPVCSPPCWNGITPGKSNLEEAEVLVNNLSNTENILLLSDSPHINESEIQFHYNDSGDSGSVVANTDNLVVSYISISTGSTLTVKGVISKFGLPESISVFSCFTDRGPECQVRMIYFKHGLAFEVISTVKDENYEDINFSFAVLEDMKISKVFFFSGGVDGYKNLGISSLVENLKKPYWDWQGFGWYDYP